MSKFNRGGLPWVLGTDVSNCVTAQDVMKTAKLDWTVQNCELVSKMVILVLSIVVLVLILILVQTLMFVRSQMKSFDALWESTEDISKYCDKFVVLYDKYRAAESETNKVKVVKEILDVAQDINNNYYRKLEENRQLLNKFNNK